MKKIFVGIAFVILFAQVVIANPDLNNDNVVDIADLIIVASNFGTSNEVADTDNNSIVDIFDVVYIASNFGTVEPPPPPPPTDTEGLIAYWTLDATREESVSSDSLTNKLMLYGPWWSEGVSDNALEFDGVEDYAEAYHDDSLNVDNELTVMAWVNIIDDGTHNPVVVKATTLESGFHLVVTGGQLRLRIANSGSFSDLSTSYNSYYGDWHHIAGVFDGSNEILFIDGIEQKRETSEINTIGTGNDLLRIGRSTTGYWGGDSRLNGFVDEVKIFDKTLNAQEIQQEMNNLPKPPETPPSFPTGNVVYAETGYPVDVQNAVNLASKLGGRTVQIPEGTFDFNIKVIVPADVHIKGTGREKTILRRTDVDTHPLFYFDCRNGENVKFSNIKVQGLHDQVTQELGMELKDCKDFQIYDSEFYGFSYCALRISGYSYGVVYKNNFIENYLPGLGYGVYSQDIDNGWTRTLEFGGKEWVFIEDNYFKDNRHAMDSCCGGRNVGRHNLIERYQRYEFMIKAHGTTGLTGTRGFQYYNNTLIGNIPSGVRPWAITIGGGDGVIYNNQLVNVGTSERGTFQLAVHGTGTDADYPAPGQTRYIYYWGNTKDEESYNLVGLEQEYDIKYLVEGREYFTDIPMPDYTPYTYPHPLRES